MQVTYFANDLSDAAVQRRVRMLCMGGAQINLLGFHRGPKPIDQVEGVAATDLGQTFAGKLGDRCQQVLQNALASGRWKDIIATSDVVLARSLDMATIAYAALVRSRSDARLAYECLDIHGTQLGTGIGSKLIRSWERWILGRSASLIVSSPAYLTNHFNRLGVALPDVILAENKRVLSGNEYIERPCLGERRPPWRIGWFGRLRCVESFQMLLGLAHCYPRLVDVTLRGRPMEDIQRLIDQHLPLPNMRFGGEYTQGELGAIYSDCDFTWAIEYAGQNVMNAKWALGNRLYEGGFYNCPAIVLAGTEMAAWLEARGNGIALRDGRELASFLTGLTPAHYRVLQRSSAAVPTADLVWSVEDCRQFTHRLAGKMV